MESSFLLDRKIISMCFNPFIDSVLILSSEQDNLELTEEDITKNIILRRFKLLKLSECNINNSNYRKLPKDTFEGYGIYFWELARKIIVVYPFGYLIIYDYQTSQLNFHFQCQGKNAYVIRNIIGSPIQKSLFLSAERMRNIYHLNYDNLKVGISYQKLVIPHNETVYDLTCHPNEKYIFAACSDSIIRIFDYSNVNQINEIKNGLVDVPLNKDNKPLKNQNEIIKKANLLSCISLDINSNGNYLLSGNENGNVYLWDALLAIKNRRQLLTKERFSGSGILSVKFIKTKQFENLNRFICLTKEGKFFISSIVMKEENNTKIYSFNKLYENSTFNAIIYSLSKYNLITSTFINISYFSNIICLKWPALRLEKIVVNEKREDYLLFTSFSAKYFFIYDNVFPKINFAIATQMKYKNYEDYIPIINKNNLVFERKIFIVDNFFIYFYDIMTGNTKKMLNYSREFNLKAIYPLKFEVKHMENRKDGSDFYFIILAENENSQKFVLFIFYDMLLNQTKSAQKFDEIIDFVILGNQDEDEFKNVFLLHKNKQHAIIYHVSDNKKENRNIEGSIIRVYNTPLNSGYCVMYRNVLSELKFSSNLKAADKLDFRCIHEHNFRLDYSEREIDIAWKKFDNRFVCAISMIEKIVITDENMKVLYSYKIGLLENPNIISSLFWVGRTLFYSKGNAINYFYGEDDIHQKVFTSDQPNTIISGVLSDRFILVSKIIGSKEVTDVIVTTPIFNPVEPILIGYLDSSNIDYNLVKEAVTNLFTNQFSQNLIDKLLKRDLKEVAWLFISDGKSSFQNIDKKVQILNDLLKFDLSLDYILPNKNLKNEMDLDELMWRLTYDHSLEYLKNTLIGQSNILISYGQFDCAIKIIELLSDYPKGINLLLISSSKEEFEKLKIIFQARGCLSYTDNLLINNVFLLMKKLMSEEINSSMKNYQKIFDNYKGEPFAFGANSEKFTVTTIKDAVNKINKKNSHLNNIQKKMLSYGETAFSQYTKLYNRETSQNELVHICSIVFQKIDQFFGHQNTVYDKNQTGGFNKKVDFTDYSVPLSNLKDSNVQENLEDESIDENLEEISENNYLTAYFHCDKGSGNVVEDVTENSTEGTLKMSNPPLENPIAISNDETLRHEENYLWSNVLEEFEPLEYEDKWGRKSPGSHSIKFSSKFGTNLKIKHNSNFLHFSKKFTFEFWLKLFNINVSIFNKESLKIDLQNGNFICQYQNNLITPIKILDYNITYNKWTHIALIHRKKNNKLKIFVNCEEVVNFNVNVNEDIGLRGDINIGDSNLDAEITEIRIWNQEIPLKFIKENYKSPLPILAENKRKLRMKINKQEENLGKKKFEFNKNSNTNRFQSFAFGAGKNNQSVLNNNVGLSNNLNITKITPVEDESINLNLSDIKNEIKDADKPTHFNVNEINSSAFNPEGDLIYPSFTSIMNQDKSPISGIRSENQTLFDKKEVDNFGYLENYGGINNNFGGGDGFNNNFGGVGFNNNFGGGGFNNNLNNEVSGFINENEFNIQNFNFNENNQLKDKGHYIQNNNFDFAKEDFNFDK